MCPPSRCNSMLLIYIALQSTYHVPVGNFTGITLQNMTNMFWHMCTFLYKLQTKFTTREGYSYAAFHVALWHRSVGDGVTLTVQCINGLFVSLCQTLSPTLQCNGLQCTASDCNALHCNAMQCTALHCTAL